MVAQVDYLVVGSGLTGAAIARTLHDAGREVRVVDRRSYLGGNVADATHESGIRYCRHGPHYFRTSSDRIWEFATRFADFYPYAAELLTYLDGEYTAWPLTRAYIVARVGADWVPEFVGTPSNFEEASLAMMPRPIYELAVKPYTECQWGVPARTLMATLAGRFDIRAADERRLTPNAKYQGLPRRGYSEWVAAMLRDIPLELDHDHLLRHDYQARVKTIFTGPIDEYYNYTLGHLQYRGQHREHSFVADTDYALPAAQVNNPKGPHIRTLEWKRMMPDAGRAIRGTLLTRETPYTPTAPDAYEYPFPDQRSRDVYERYRRCAAADSHVVFAGRLALNRYYDMDAALAAALHTAEKILTE